MADVSDAFFEWLDTEGRGSGPLAPTDSDAVQIYFHGVARARFVLRRVFRGVDEQAKRAGLDPLEHQALIQILGADAPLRVNEVAERLDIPAALASRLIKALESKELVTRGSSQADRRTTLVSATEEGANLLVKIDAQVQRYVGRMQEDFSELDRTMALGIFAFYVGAPPTPELLARFRTIIRPED